MDYPTSGANKVAKIIAITVLTILVLAGIFYFWSLNNAKKLTQVSNNLNQELAKTRDMERVADLRGIHTGLELWYYAHSSSYPDRLEILNLPSNLTTLFSDSTKKFSIDDPLTKQPYFYTRCGTDSYHLGANLETNSPDLQSDSDKAQMCASDKINGADNKGCDGKEGFFCYDLTI